MRALAGWAIAAAIGLMFAAGAARAQAAFPTRPVRLVIPVPVGSAPDLLARLVAQGLQAKWGQPALVEPHPGAAMNIAGELLARADPDGYTLLLAPPSPFALNQHLYAKLNYDPAAFAYVSVLVGTPNVLLVPANSPAKSVADLVAMAKAKPGGLNYAAVIGSTLHLTSEAFNARAGVDIGLVPYKGVAEMIPEMLGGRIDTAFINLIDAYPQIVAGALRALAVGGDTRSAALPDTPTLSETWPGFQSVTFYAVAAPPKTPPAVVEALSAAIREAFQTPQAKKIVDDLHATPILDTPDAARAYVEADSARWRDVIVKNHIAMP